METTRDTTTTLTDPRPLFGSAVSLAADVIARTSPEQMDDPTPCPGFDVRALLGHMVMVLDRVAALGCGDDPLAVGPREIGADADWSRVWDEAVGVARAAWSDDSVLERVMVLPWTQEPGAGILLGYVGEITVHTWDLAKATGADPVFDDEVVAAGFGAMRRMLPVEGRDNDFVPFAGAVDVAPTSPPIDRLVAYTGRRP